MSKERASVESGKPPATVKAATRSAELFASAVRLETAGKLLEAESLYRQILIEDPSHADSFHKLGLLALQSGQNDSAVGLLASAVRLNSREPLFLFHLGNAFLQAHRAEKAVAAYRHALNLQPGLVEAHHNLGLALCALGELDAAFAAIRDGFEVRSRTRAGVKAPPLTPYKTRHDHEQLEYLIDAGIIDAAAYPSWRQRSPRRFQELFDSLAHIEGGERLGSPAVNPHTDGKTLQRQWDESTPKLVVIDDLLTQKGLAELRRFCLGSTIWQRPYEGGYLGALPETGLACPLLAQIAAELGQRYPAILEQHTLNLWWAFQYDSRRKGINLHADFAAVNVNFWITPDEANLDPAGGGLVVWDTPAPLDWDFADYNQNETRARDFLAQAGSKPIMVPYRANRAVIFDSNLFHETDRFHFQEGYRNRRINITLLYGWRA